jgi:hypothetical protein
MKPKDAVKIINKFGTMPAKERLRKTVLCKTKHINIKINVKTFLNKILTLLALF